MADVTMNSATIPNITPEATDLLLAWDTSAGANGEFAISLLQTLYATLTGGNTFTGNQAIDKGSPALTLTGSGLGTVVVADMDNGTGSGGLLSAGRNLNAGTPAPGVLRIRDSGNVYRTMWPDNTGLWRTGTGLPSSATETGGTVVGSQSSSLDQKDVQGEPITGAEALALIVAAAREAVKRFVYKGQSGFSQEIDPVTGEIIEVPWSSPPPYGGQEFTGLIVDYAPRYGTDIDEAHPAGRALNTITATGDSFLAIAEIARRVEELETRLATAVDAIEAALANFETPTGE